MSRPAAARVALYPFLAALIACGVLSIEAWPFSGDGRRRASLMEVAFPVVLFVARTRPFFGVVAITMHAGTWLTLGLDYWTWVAVDAIVLVYATAPIMRAKPSLEPARAEPAAAARRGPAA